VYVSKIISLINYVSMEYMRLQTNVFSNFRYLLRDYILIESVSIFMIHTYCDDNLVNGRFIVNELVVLINEFSEC